MNIPNSIRSLAAKVRSAVATALAAPFKPLTKRINTYVSQLEAQLQSKVEEHISNMDQSLVAECFHPSDLAQHISISDIAYEIDTDNVAGAIDPEEVASCMDSYEVAAAVEVDPEEVAEHIDVDLDEIADVGVVFDDEERL